MTTFTQNIVAPAKAGAYLAPQPATTDAIGSSLRWSDGDFCPIARRPSEGWGPSRLSIKRRIMLQSAIRSRLRWSDGRFSLHKSAIPS